jgi:pyruvate/2-oxoglutarate/acetoin dehydrogenase E1 component/TPP-dependent pyruvate/acetoin dehydrogenase alpha subunit
MTAARFYRALYRIRRVEEEIARVYPTDKVRSPVHLSIGQEAVAVGVCAALRPEDVVFASYRGHAAYLAKGGDLRAMVAELFGRATGCAKGKGGSMHLVDARAGVMGTSAVVGTTIPHAVGHAYAARLRREPRVVVSFFGDGATEEGVFDESLNFAALKRLPVLFVCENNGYAIHTPLRARQPQDDLPARAASHGIPARRLPDDVEQVHEAVAAAAEAMRRGEAGPFFFECRTYRWREHVGPGEDYDLGYRTREEARPFVENDAVARAAAALPPAERAAIEAEVDAEVQDALAFAEASPFPGPEELVRDVVAPPTPAPAPAPPADTRAPRTLSYVEALREAADQLLAADPRVVVYGLDVDDPKAIQGTTAGLLRAHGPERVFGTPLSEDAMTGVGIGMALAGLRPVHVHIRMDFLLLAMNQLVNIAAKARYMWGGQVHVPLTVRCIIGRSWGQGAQHSQGLHALFMHVPGLKVAAPFTPYDAKGCLVAAVRDPDPVIVVEHRLLYPTRGEVPAVPYEVRPGRARVLAEGDDVTVVGISQMLRECLQARELLMERGLRAEVLDPVWLAPLDVDTIAASAARTRRLVVVDTAWLACGASAEIVAAVTERLAGLPLRVLRLGYAPATCPPTPTLEALFYPDAARIAAEVWRLVTGEPGWQPAAAPDAVRDGFRGPF